MFEYICGTLVDLTPEKAVLDTSGLGYKILIPLSVYSSLLGKQDVVKLYISAIYREDSQRLFGFISKDQRNLFEKICDISGIGPKIALSIIGHLEEKDLFLSVQNQDVKSLTKVPGLGKKTAERLIIELKDKFSKLNMQKETISSDVDMTLVDDALAALMNLGYQKNAAQKAILKALKETDGSGHLPEIITTALKLI